MAPRLPLITNSPLSASHGQRAATLRARLAAKRSGRRWVFLNSRSSVSSLNSSASLILSFSPVCLWYSFGKRTPRVVF
jgi:hypothetical protein